MKVTGRSQVMEYMDRTRECGAVMPIFCYDCLPNLEAILYAVQTFAQEHGIQNPPVGTAMTFDYEAMSQAGRVFTKASKWEGFAAMQKVLDVICSAEGSTYGDVVALPHLDHADPATEEVVWSEHIDNLATVMVDASLGDRSLNENIELTHKAVETYGKRILIEGALQAPAAEGHHEAGDVGLTTDADYAAAAKSYVDQTGVDMVVLELGSVQQTLGWANYNSERAQAVTEAIGTPMIVLHGGSSVPLKQQKTFADDGIVRFNVWTRIGREGACAGAEKIVQDIDEIRKGDPTQLYATRFTEAHFDKQVEIMKDILGAIGYANFAKK